MKLSIIIVNYKTPALLKLCIKSIQSSILNIPYEIIVVDSESQEETQETVREDFSEVSFLAFKENIGYAKGVNAGIKKACGDFLLILNPDVIVSEQAIKKMIEFIKNKPQIGIIGPQLINFNGAIQDSCYRFVTPKIILYRRTFLGRFPWTKEKVKNYLMKDWDHQSIREVDWLLGAALMTSKIALDKVGLIDERFFLYFEDVDWCRRFWRAGFKVVYFPYAKMYHYHQRSSAAHRGLLGVFDKATRIHIHSAIKYFQKYGLKKNEPNA